MTSDTADTIAGYIALGVFILFLLAWLTAPGGTHIMGVIVFPAVVGLIARLGLGLFVRKS